MKSFHQSGREVCQLAHSVVLIPDTEFSLVPVVSTAQSWRWIIRCVHSLLRTDETMGTGLAMELCTQLKNILSGTRGGRTRYWAFVMGVVATTLISCANDVNPPPRAQCLGPGCSLGSDPDSGGSNTERDTDTGLVRDTRTEFDADSDETGEPPADAGPQPEVDPDLPDTPDVGPPEDSAGEELFEPDTPDGPDAVTPPPPTMVICDSNADCPVLGTSCVRELLWSHDNQGNPIRVSTLLPEVPEGWGVCTADCSSPGTDCTAIRSGDPSEPWVCQLLSWTRAPHPGVDPNWEPYFPLDTPVSPNELEAGVPFAAMCRPSFRTVRDDTWEDQCRTCVIDRECGGGRCVDLAEANEASNADGNLLGFCALPCSTDQGCPVGFACDSTGEVPVCLPVGQTCSACLDIDGDGRGIGRCTPSGAPSVVDCNDLDHTVYYRGATTGPERERCEALLDANCNGIGDDAEMIGQSGYNDLHCNSCNDPCNASVVTASATPNGTIACVPDTMGGYECAAACVPAFDDCDGRLDNGCETSIDTITNCGGCGEACTAPNPTVPQLACAGEPASGYECQIAACADAQLDCDGAFDNGCEVAGNTDVRNCGACDNSCVGVLANATAVCRDSQCAIGSCGTGFADCDRERFNGCEVNTRTSMLHCGNCGAACVLPNAVTNCSAGQCGIVSCNPGWADCDGITSNGCEINTRTNVDNCGRCGFECSFPNANAACVEGACQLTTCASGFADCNRTVLGCETDLSLLGNCGACGQTCETIPSELRTCVPGSRAGRFECECDDDDRTVEVCNGLHSVCGQDLDEGCPTQLGFVSALLNGNWLKHLSSLTPVADQTVPPQGAFTRFYYLVGLDVTHDRGALIQLTPLWMNPTELEGAGTAGTTRNYSHYTVAQTPIARLFRSTEVLGVPSASINAPSLQSATPPRSYVSNARLTCERITPPTDKAFVLPVAIHLWIENGSDGWINGIQLECQAFEIQMISSAFAPEDRYGIVRVGATQLTSKVGHGTRLIGSTPGLNYATTVPSPIIRLSADLRRSVYPTLNADGTINVDGYPIQALRAVYLGPGWGPF